MDSNIYILLKIKEILLLIKGYFNNNKLMQNIEQNKQNNKIPEKLWHHMLRPDYTIPGCMFELTFNQVTKLI